MNETYESQRKSIKAWLLGGNDIDPMRAITLFGCMRLSAVIYLLKYEDGLNIKSEMVYLSNRKRYARYFIEKSK
jgi:hypothetical protein